MSEEKAKPSCMFGIKDKTFIYVMCMYTSSLTFTGSEDGSEEILFVTIIKLGGKREKRELKKKKETKLGACVEVFIRLR